MSSACHFALACAGGRRCRRLNADKARAIALVAAVTEPQRVRQALAYAAWLAYHGLEIDLDTVLAAWEAPEP